MSTVTLAGESLLSGLRPEARNAPESGIVEVVNHGRLKEGLIPLWVGEGDLPTPDFIARAANASLAAGETFYTWQRGIPDLREALARYHTTLYGQPFAMDRFFITGSGMQAVQIVVRMITGPGDEVVIPTPAWPNVAAAIGIGGAIPVNVPMDYVQGRFSLDLDRLAAAITPRTRAIAINSPANPTGWTATKDELAAILALARKHGIWIIADEIYGRFVYDGSARAASFHDVMEAEDRILFVQTFSKNWAMTGWRAGWVIYPRGLAPTFAKLGQYSTTSIPTFVQHACIAALEEGDGFIRTMVDRCAEARSILVEGLSRLPGVTVAPPDGAFYLMARMGGDEPSLDLALRLLREAKVGVAPGTAFGPEGEGLVRMCFAISPDLAREAVRRLAGVLGTRAPAAAAQ